MKKICALLVVLMLVVTTGCGNLNSKRIIKEMVEKTYTAVENGQIENALTYGKTAIQEGHDDDEFAELTESLELYLDVKEALDDNDLKTAKDKYDKFDACDLSVISDISTELKKELDDKTEEADDIIESLEKAVENDKDDDDFVASSQSKLEDYVLTEDQELRLKNIIEEHESKSDGDDWKNDDFFQTVEEINGYIEALKEGMDKYDTALVASMMVKLYRLEPYMNENQRRMAFTYWDEWDDIQEATEPSVVISPDEAIEIARRALDIPSYGCIVAVQNGEYYIIRAEVDYGDHIDECGCNVSTYDGAVFGEVG